MLNTLERTGGRYGLQTMCEGGGTANVTIIETASELSAREKTQWSWTTTPRMLRPASMSS